MESTSELEVGEEEKGQKLLVFFLFEDEEDSVIIEEVETLDLAEVLMHLNLGGSVFLKPKGKLSGIIASRK